MRQITILLNALMAMLTATPLCSYAQTEFPSKPIRIIAPAVPGGPNDTSARIIAQKLNEAWGQAVVVENKPGANGIIGAEAAAKANPDGYTLFMATDTSLTMLQYAYKQLPYSPETDFRAVTLVLQSPIAFITHSSLGVTNLAELVALAKSKPGQISYGEGVFTVQLITERFALQSGIQLLHIGYKGAGQSTAALLAGDVNMTADALTSYIPYIGKGRFNIVAVTGTSRHPAIPDVPTFGELGYPGNDAGVWLCLVVPAKTPDAIVAKLSREIRRILQLPDVRERLRGLGSEAIPSTPEHAENFIKTERVKWEKVIRETGIRLD